MSLGLCRPTRFVSYAQVTLNPATLRLGIDLGISVLGKGEGHRDRWRIDVGGGAPRLVVPKRQFSPVVARDAARFAAVKNGDEFSVHFLFLRAELAMESISTSVSTL